MKILWRAYCFLAGMILGPALMAGGLAYFMGLLPLERVERAYATLTGDPSTIVSGEAQKVPQPGRPTLDAPPDDLLVWERRLDRLRTGIDSNVENLGREIDTYEQESLKLEQVRKALSALLSVQVGKEVTPHQVVTEADRFVAELAKKTSDAEKLPKLLATLETVEPQSLALILAGRDGSPGLEEQQTVQLLARFPPRKAGAVLSEVGDLDPALAARLVSGLGGQQPDELGNP